MITIGVHHEIDVRYAWQRREQKFKRGSSQLIAALRLREIERVHSSRFGSVLPDDDSGMDDLDLAAHAVAGMGGDVERHIQDYVWKWAPWAFFKNDFCIVAFSRRIAAHPLRFKADTIARRLGVTMAERTALKLTTIGAIDCNVRQRARLRDERKRARAIERRRALGAVPRAQYEAESLSRTRPWDAMGISRSTWYRRGKPMPVQSQWCDLSEWLGQVRAQQTEGLIMLGTHVSHGTLPAPKKDLTGKNGEGRIDLNRDKIRFQPSGVGGFVTALQI
jgi:hypothetical protein